MFSSKEEEDEKDNERWRNKDKMMIQELKAGQHQVTGNVMDYKNTNDWSRSEKS